MRIATLVLGVVALFAVAYRLYGRFLTRVFQVDDRRTTPAHEVNDGVDYVPTGVGSLLPQHFSSIAAAGPIVGPILAGLWFGWLPALLWIVLGNILIGSVHDFSTLMISVRHQARSIAEVVSEEMGRRAYSLFLLFIWISLMYVIVAFTDLTASTFVAPEVGGGVATSSLLYLALSVLLGWMLTRWKVPARIAMGIAVLLLLLIIWGGQKIPIALSGFLGLAPAKGWGVAILLYCWVASVLPMWMLLQPRGTLGGYFLYASLAVGFSGLLLGGHTIAYPAFLGFESPKGAPLFPILFITVACGACSGFHGLVCSGTSSKQLAKEGDAHPVGYGGMLLEGLVAVVALSTVMMFAPGDPALTKGPTEIYATGLASLANVLGVPKEVAYSFGLLAFATFVYDTLDVSTRLGRYIFQELTGWREGLGRKVGGVATIAVPLLFLLTTGEGAYITFWPLFGASNQMLAGLSLLGVSVWLARTGRNLLYTLVPTGFILVITLWSLARFVAQGGINAALSALLIGITLFLIIQAYRVVRQAKTAA
jgi:carbon starvation protein